MKRLLRVIFVALFAMGITAGSALAATTADVTVTATPSYISITDNVTTVDFGTVAESSNSTVSTGYIGIVNSSSVQTDITIAVTTANWTGGGEWVSQDNGIPGANAAALFAHRGAGAWGTAEIAVHFVTGEYLYENCPATTDFYYGLKLVAPTSFDDGVAKSITVRVTAVAG